MNSIELFAGADRQRRTNDMSMTPGERDTHILHSYGAALDLLEGLLAFEPQPSDLMWLRQRVAERIDAYEQVTPELERVCAGQALLDLYARRLRGDL